MTLLESLNYANQIDGIKGMSFASAQEFNAFKDSFVFLDYPRNIIVPISLTGQVQTARTSEILNIQGWMITRLNQDTNDFRSVKIEPDYIEPMRQAARIFIKRLVMSALTDPQVQNISYRIVPEYMWTDAHLFGVSYSVQWPVNGVLCI